MSFICFWFSPIFDIDPLALDTFFVIFLISSYFFLNPFLKCFHCVLMPEHALSGFRLPYLSTKMASK